MNTLFSGLPLAVPSLSLQGPCLDPCLDLNTTFSSLLLVVSLRGHQLGTEVCYIIPNGDDHYVFESTAGGTSEVLGSKPVCDSFSDENCTRKK
jgi:hypothetical protein